MSGFRVIEGEGAGKQIHYNHFVALNSDVRRSFRTTLIELWLFDSSIIGGLSSTEKRSFSSCQWFTFILFLHVCFAPDRMRRYRDAGSKELFGVD
jgi:hypothetical protein